MRRIPLARMVLAAVVALAASTAAVTATGHPATEGPHAPATTYQQPIIDGIAADPMIQFIDGYYYLSHNKHGARGALYLRRATSLAGLRTAPDTVVYDPDQNPSHPATSKYNAWPITWLLPWGGKYYLFGEGFAQGSDAPRSFVLEADDPWGPYAFKAELPGPGGAAAYQTNPFVVNDELYLATSRYPELFVSRMVNPWTHETGWRPLEQPVSGSWHCTATAEDPPGTKSRCLVEGASTVVHDGRVFLFHSAGGFESPDYCVGMLSADVTADLTVQANWRSSPSCVLSRHDAAGVYGPGTLNVFSSPDGTEQWAVYHVKITAAIDWSGLDRRLMAAPITWSSDGTPHLDPPDPLGTQRDLPSGDPGS